MYPTTVCETRQAQVSYWQRHVVVCILAQHLCHNVSMAGQRSLVQRSLGRLRTHSTPRSKLVVGQRTLLVYCCCLVLPKVHCVFLLEPTACCARWPKGGVTHLNVHALSQSNMHTGVPEPL
jgi:hypothetical protein